MFAATHNPAVERIYTKSRAGSSLLRWASRIPKTQDPLPSILYITQHQALASANYIYLQIKGGLRDYKGMGSPLLNPVVHAYAAPETRGIKRRPVALPVPIGAVTLRTGRSVPSSCGRPGDSTDWPRPASRMRRRLPPSSLPKMAKAASDAGCARRRAKR